MPTTSAVYPEKYFQRKNLENDALFFAPYKVKKFAPEAKEALHGLITELLPEGGEMLDVMSSATPFVPDGLSIPGSVTAVGMHLESMGRNPLLDTVIAQDVNVNPVLPLEPEMFDLAVCTLSIPYVLHPLELFQSIHQSLKPDGKFVIAFTHRFFADKAISSWMYNKTQDRVALVRSYFQFSAPWDDMHLRMSAPKREDVGSQLLMMWGTKATKWPKIEQPADAE